MALFKIWRNDSLVGFIEAGNETDALNTYMERAIDNVPNLAESKLIAENVDPEYSDDLSDEPTVIVFG